MFVLFEFTQICSGVWCGLQEEHSCGTVRVTHECGLGLMSGGAAITNLSACSPVGTSTLSAFSSFPSSVTGAGSSRFSVGTGCTLSVITGFSSSVVTGFSASVVTGFSASVTGSGVAGVCMPFVTGLSSSSGPSPIVIEVGLSSSGWAFVLTVSEVSTVSEMIGLGSSAMGVTASALGGVMLKKLESMPTAGGRPRGRRVLRDTLARFSTRQSDCDNRLRLSIVLESNG